MKVDPGRWWRLARKAATSWLDDYAPSMGAALSYYTVFSLAPILLIVVAVAGLFFGDDAARGALSDQLRGLMGADGARAVEGLLASASKPSRGIVATVTGVVVLLVGATSVFAELQDALDRVWDVPARAKPSGIWGLLRSRFLSLGMILGIAFMLMVSLVVSAAVAALGTWWSPVFGDWESLAQAATFVFGFAVTTLGFALIYRLMPHAKVQWRDVWVGAVVTSLLFSLGRFVISLYIGKSGVASGFGAAGSLIVVFVWVYYSAQIFLLGAEFTWVYATEIGSMKGATAGNAEGSGDRATSMSVPAQGTEIASAERPSRRPSSPRDAKAAALILASLAVGSVLHRFVLPRMGKGGV